MTNEQLYHESPIAACWKVEDVKIAQMYIKAEDIIYEVSEYSGISYELMQHKTRKREVVNARQIAMSLMSQLTRLSLKSIGLMFGDRDHTTVIHSSRTVRDLMETDDEYYRQVKQIETALLKYRTKEIINKRRNTSGYIYKVADPKPVVRLADKYSYVRSL